MSQLPRRDLFDFVGCRYRDSLVGPFLAGFGTADAQRTPDVVDFINLLLLWKRNLDVGEFMYKRPLEQAIILGNFYEHLVPNTVAVRAALSQHDGSEEIIEVEYSQNGDENKHEGDASGSDGVEVIEHVDNGEPLAPFNQDLTQKLSA